MYYDHNKICLIVGCKKTDNTKRSCHDWRDLFVLKSEKWHEYTPKSSSNTTRSRSMIHIVHRGLGGKYATYMRESVKRISRRRSVNLSCDSPTKPGYRVAVCQSGQPYTQSQIKDILDKECVTFYLGDSRGLPQDIIESSDAVMSISQLPIPHQLEAAIVVDQLEHIVFEGV